MTKALAAILLAVSLVACAAPLEPYGPIPKTCAGIDAEMCHEAKEIKAILGARMGKEALVAVSSIAVALEYINPAAALIGPVLRAVRVDTAGRAERIRHLANAKLHKGCE